MKKIQIVIFLLIACPLGICLDMELRPKIVLLTSLDTPDIWYRKKGWQVSKKLEDIFKYSFERSSFELKIIHKATMFDLYKELSAPGNLGVFWVSHSSEDDQKRSEIMSSAGIITIDNIDVSDIFTLIHPNMRYVGIVGCNAKPIIQRLQRDGYYTDNKDLFIHAFDKKISAVKGLKESILKSVDFISATYFQRHFDDNDYKRKNYFPRLYEKDPYFKKFNSNICSSPRLGFHVRLKRENWESELLPEVQVRHNDGLLGVFPALEAGGSQNMDIYFPEKKRGLQGFKVFIESKSTKLKKIKLGHVIFSPSWRGGEWDLVSTTNGQAIGVNKNVYRYKGILPNKYDLVPHRTFKCLSARLYSSFEDFTSQN